MCEELTHITTVALIKY